MKNKWRWLSKCWNERVFFSKFVAFSQCTKVRFVIFLSGGFTSMAIINPLERKVAKPTSVQCLDFLHLWYFVKPIWSERANLRLINTFNKIELMKLLFFVSLCSVDLNWSGRWSKMICCDVVSWSHTWYRQGYDFWTLLWYKLEQHFRFDVIYCHSTSQCTGPNLG